MGRDVLSPGRAKGEWGFQSTLPAWGETLYALRFMTVRMISIHSPRMGRDLFGLYIVFCTMDFNPLSPHGERHAPLRGCICCSYFNPLSPHGERPGAYRPPPCPPDFNPLSPHGERHSQSCHMSSGREFQSTLPAWGETFDRAGVSCRPIHFNPLSPHGERRRRSHAGPVSRNFNPLSPHGERPLMRCRWLCCVVFQSTLPAWGETICLFRRYLARAKGFQSTLPAWGETGNHLREKPARSDFNPLSPHGERPAGPPAEPPTPYFNPLSPHGERPVSLYVLCPRTAYFNPLSPHGERRLRHSMATAAAISIHSPRMGRDAHCSAGGSQRRRTDFNPLSPHGERPVLDTMARVMEVYFNPLSPHGERPAASAAVHQRLRISIHSPRMGRDSKRTQLFEEKNWRICTTLYLFASKGVLPADKKTF